LREYPVNLAEAKKRATELEIQGRSKMNKAELLAAIEIAEAEIYEAKKVEATEEYFGGEAILPDYRQSPVPMTQLARIDAYADQVGGLHKITDRQHRRIVKKAHRALKRQGMFDLYPNLRTASGKRKAEKASA
jgi:hypothetical protein